MFQAICGPSLPYLTQSSFGCQHRGRFSIVAGGFRSVKDPQNTVWGLAFSTISDTVDSNGNFVSVGLIDMASGHIVTRIPATYQQYYQNLRMPAMAYDYDGDSLYLGAPVHFTVEGVLNTGFVLQEPPQHAYYDNNPRSNTYGQIISVSREDTFNVQLQDSTGTTFSSKSTDTTGATVNAPMVPASQQAFDGTNGTVALQYSSTSGSGYISSYSHSLNTSIDVQVSNKTSASFFGEGGSVQTSVKTGFHDGISFGKRSTSDQTTTNSTGITLNKSSGDPTQAYNFYPVLYITQDGTVKAAHAVDILRNAAGREFRASVYATIMAPTPGPNRAPPMSSWVRARGA